MDKNLIESLADMIEECFLQRLPWQDCKAISELTAAGCKLVTVPPEVEFIEAGSPVERVCALLEGRAQVVCTNQHGKAIVQDEFCLPQMFGYMELISGAGTHSATVKASTKCVVLEFSNKLFTVGIKENLRFANIIINNLLELAVRNMNKYESMLLNSPRDSVAQFFLQCCEKNRLPYTVTVSRKAMSELLHINMRSLYRYIRQLRELGLCGNIKGETLLTEEHYSKLKIYCRDLA